MTRSGIGEKVRGQSLVELALVLPIFLVIIVGLFDFGRAIYTSNTIGNAARVATRVAIVDQNEARVRQAAIDAATGVSLAPSDVVVSFSCTDRIVVCHASVELTTQYVAATPLIHQVVGMITLNANSEMPIERVHVSP
jgi:Flp pilus assembly protein TadG